MAKAKASIDTGFDSGPSVYTFDTGDNLAAGFGGSPLDFAPPAESWDDVDIEAEAAVEISAALAAFKERAAEADRRFVDNTDSEYWFAVGFQNRAQKDEFLHKAGLFDHGDKYLDGVVVAKKLGIKLETPVPAMPRFGHDTRLHRLAPELNEPY